MSQYDSNLLVVTRLANGDSDQISRTWDRFTAAFSARKHIKSMTAEARCVNPLEYKGKLVLRFFFGPLSLLAAKMRGIGVPPGRVNTSDNRLTTYDLDITRDNAVSTSTPLSDLQRFTRGFSGDALNHQIRFSARSVDV